MPKFEKGGPPGPGRPPGSKSGSTICREWADKFGFAFLMRVAEGKEKFPHSYTNAKGKTINTERTPSASERINVAQYLVDRAYGKATAAVSLDLNAKLTLEHILAYSREPAPPTILTGEVVPPQQLPGASA